MIFMTVSNYNTAYLVGIPLNIGEIGYNYINARHIGVGKSKTAVEYEHIVRAFKNGHIFADLIESSKRNYSHRSFSHFT